MRGKRRCPNTPTYMVISCEEGHKLYVLKQGKKYDIPDACPVCGGKLGAGRVNEGWGFLSSAFNEQRNEIRKILYKFHDGRRYVSAVILYREIIDELPATFEGWNPINIKQMIAATFAEEGLIRSGKNCNAWINPQAATA